MTALKRIDALIERYGLLKVFVPVFLFFQPFSHIATIKDAVFIAILLIFIIRLLSKGVRIDLKDKTITAILVLFAIAALSSLLSPYMADSLTALRKNLFYGLVVFMVISSEYGTFRELRPVILSLMLGFFGLSVIIALMYEPRVLFNWLSYKDAPFLAGYSLFATFYVPLATGYILLSREPLKIKAPLACLLLLAVILTILNNHRTQFAAIVVASALIAMLSKRWKALIISATVFAVAMAIIWHVKPDSFSRHKTIFAKESYTSSRDINGLNDRDALWKATWEMAKDRPLLGWGYGWKKMGLVVRDKGYLAKWDKGSRAYVYFSDAGYGRANPHNLPLQILFEIGFLGLGAFLFFWLTVFLKAAAMIWNNRASPGAGESSAFLKATTMGMLVSYGIINLTNGLWQEAYGNVILSFAAIAVVLYREALGRKDADN